MNNPRPATPTARRRTPRLRLRGIPEYLTGPYSKPEEPALDALETMALTLPVPAPKTPLSQVAWRCPNEDCSPRLFRMGRAATARPAAAEDAALMRRNAGAPGATCPYCGTDGPDETFIRPSLPGPSRNLKLREIECDVCSRNYGVYAINLFCPDCGARNLHVHYRLEARLISHQVALAHQTHKGGDDELAFRLLDNAHNDAVTALHSYLRTIFTFLSRANLQPEAAADAEDQAAIRGFQTIAEARALFGQVEVDPFAGLSPQALDCLRFNLEERRPAGSLPLPSAEARTPARDAWADERTGAFAAEENLRFIQISGDLIRSLEEICPKSKRHATPAPRRATQPLRFTNLPRTVDSPELREFNRLRRSCRETITDISRGDLVSRDIAGALEIPPPPAAAEPAAEPPQASPEPTVAPPRPPDLDLARRYFTRQRLPGSETSATEPAATGARVTATVTLGSGLLRKSFQARITHCGETGARIIAPGAGLKPGDVVWLRWWVRIPGADAEGARRCEMMGTIAESVVSTGGTTTYGLRFHRRLSERLREMTSWQHKLLSATAVALVAASMAYFKVFNIVWYWYSPLFRLYSLIAFGFIISRIILAIFYEEPSDTGFLPTVSVAVAAKNEEDCIGPTIEHIYASHYPKELMEVIAVDDGSTDHTWKRMQELAPRYPGLKLIHFEKNLGKRQGMAEAARLATGEILVYIDSDSYVEPEAIYRIVQAFRDQSVGAVAGHTLVNVEPHNLISKMECVRYYVSHRILKAAEGIFGTVTCCPGALSAYRRESVMKVLDAWLHQKFLGVQATFGDDRSLTNYILRTRRVLYHHGARCKTKVPDHWVKYFKQQLRWKKSWSRETFIASRLMAKEHPIAAISYYAGVVLTLVSPLIAFHAMVYLPIVSGVHPLQYVGGLLLSYLLLGLICFFLTRTRYWFYGMGFALMYIGLLSWQNYYAMFTINKTAWGTR